MDTFYHFSNNEGDIIFNNFPSELSILIGSTSNTKSTIDILFVGKKRKCRYGYKLNNNGALCICSFDKKHVNSYKIFREFLNISSISMKSILDFKKEISTSQNNQTQELIHNLTSLNTHNIQDLFAFVSQKDLSKNLYNQNETIKLALIEQPINAAKTLLRQIKNNLAMKIEFSVFEKTLKEFPSVEKEEDYIRPTVLSILQIFISDFEEKKIEVRLAGCEKRLQYDYDCFSVSLFYLFDNAVKYACPKSIFNISFIEETDSFSIHLDMVSLKIKNSEIPMLCENNYRTPLAIEKDKNGSGIGMYRLQKTLKLNDAYIEVIPRYHQNKKTVGGFDYEANKFKVNFTGQQDWFEVNKT